MKTWLPLLLAVAACSASDDGVTVLTNSGGKADGAQATITLSESKPHRQLEVDCDTDNRPCKGSLLFGTPDDGTLDLVQIPMQVARVDVYQVPLGSTADAHLVKSAFIMLRRGADHRIIGCASAGGLLCGDEALSFDGGPDSGPLFRFEISALPTWDWWSVPEFDLTLWATWG